MLQDKTLVTCPLNGFYLPIDVFNVERINKKHQDLEFDFKLLVLQKQAHEYGVGHD